MHPRDVQVSPTLRGSALPVTAATTCYGDALNNIGIKVFSATKARDREVLGDVITEWIRSHPDYEVFDKIVTQSSDAEFHCLAITVFYRTR